MDNRLDEDVFARQKIQAEKKMRIAVAVLAIVLLISLYFLLDD